MNSNCHVSPELGILAHTYLDAIKSGTVPCLENAVNTLAERENSIALQKATDHYSEQMDQQVRLPTDTLQELLDIHAVCEKKAIAVFMDRSFKDDQRKFQEKLVVKYISIYPYRCLPFFHVALALHFDFILSPSYY